MFKRIFFPNLESIHFPTKGRLSRIVKNTRKENILLNHTHYRVSMKKLYANVKRKKNTFSHFTRNINVWIVHTEKSQHNTTTGRG